MATDRSDRTIYLRVLTPFVLAALTLVLVSAGGIHALSGARAYVGGESLWSKASGRAVAQLRAHALRGAAASPCAPLAETLAVPLGDRVARLALDQPQPDLDAARSGFLRGGNRSDDIDALIDLYLDFGALPQLREPIEAWRRGDALIEQLRALGDRICAAGPIDAARADADLLELDRLDAALIEAESAFSASLGRSAHLVERLLTLAIVLLGLLLIAVSVWYVTRSLRAQVAQRRALLEANTRWALAGEAAGLGMFVHHVRSDSFELDRQARELYGLDPESDAPVAGIDAIQLVHPDDRARVEAMRRDRSSPNEPLRARYRIVTPAGSTRHIEVVVVRREGAARPWAQQLPGGQTLGVLRDVSDEVLNARLQVEKDAAERIARARSEFLSRLSHELRTPLNAVLGLAQVLEIDTEEPLGPLQRQRVELILQSGWHLLHLVDDVLDLTRIDAGQVALKPVPTDLRAVMQASLQLVEPERQRCGVRVDDRWPLAPARVLADPARLQQVFVNLLSNACKYNARGGKLTLGHRERGDQVGVTIDDEGPGISAAQLAELFQPFKRLDQTADQPGTGLGLVVAKLLTEQMQGRIEVASTPGRGSSFTVWLRKV